MRFAVDCPNLTPTATTTVGAGEVLDIEGDGHVGRPQRRDQRRLFAVTGGRLTVRGVTLHGGAAIGANGAAGTHGPAGVAGAPGSSGVSGTAGAAGTSGGAGGDGRPPPPGPVARPGASAGAEPCTSPRAAPPSSR